MQKGYRQYLRGAINVASVYKDPEAIIDMLQQRRIDHKRPTIALIDDIVSDARFYTTLDDEFPHEAMTAFIDAIPQPVWSDTTALTCRKEEFLNQMFVMHMTDLGIDERRSQLKRMLLGMRRDGEPTLSIRAEDDSDDFPFGVNDMTEPDDDTFDPSMLPDNIKQLQQVGRGAAPSQEAKAEYLQSIPHELRRLAMLIGRAGGVAQEPTRGRFQHARRSDIDGITVGNDLNSLLPVELAMLATPETYDVFLDNYTRRRLQVFASASQSFKEATNDQKGPILMCIDTSGSMSGEPETMAKTLALAIAIIAQGDKRPLFVINYSHTVSFFALTDLDRQWSKFMAFLATSYSGGNDEDSLFNFIFNILPSSPKYKRDIANLDNADMLIISDYQWARLSHESVDRLNDAHAAGMRFFSLLIDPYGLHLDDFAKSFASIVDGTEYLNLCDYRFIYRDNTVTQQK